ncbi:MAG: chemotaxis protein CheW [Synergistaceae bacterium]|nr:chemotaxis protein CheW [Synergistaceae bacterium]
MAAAAAVKEKVQPQGKDEIGGEQITLVFALGGEDYGLDVKYVKEIVRIPPFITRVPNAPSSVRGVINLRGSIVPVFDMRQKMEVAGKDLTDEARIVVLSWNEVLFGIIVDGVREVSTIYDGQIEPAPQLSVSIERKYLLGVAKRDDGRLIVLLDLPVLFGIDDILDDGRTAN